jgi:hypothetical protein
MPFRQAQGPEFAEGQPTAGRSDALFMNTSIPGHARSRQRWLILMSLGVFTRHE